MARALVLAVVLAASCTQPPPAPHSRAYAARPAPRSFVRVRGGCLWHNGAPIRLVGSSAFYLQEQAAREARGEPGARGHLAAAFDSAQRAGVTLLRVAAFNDGPRDQVAIQRERGVLAAPGIVGLDRIVAEAGRRGLWLVVVLSNYWDDYGGLAQYLRWRGHAPGERWRAFTDPALREDVAAYARALATRVNPLTGLRYADDATILGWEVMNEPRGEGLSDAGESVAAFVAHVARALREVAPRQLVLAGDEGFDADVRGYDVAYWSAAGREALVGSRRHESFRRLVENPMIDAATVHWYPEAWGVGLSEARVAGERWVREHARIAAAAGKPLLVEEFGLRAVGEGALDLAARRQAYQTWFEAAAAEPNVAALMPWGLTYPERPGQRDGFEWGDAPLERDPYAGLVRAWSIRWLGAPPCQ